MKENEASDAPDPIGRIPFVLDEALTVLSRQLKGGPRSVDDNKETVETAKFVVSVVLSWDAEVKRAEAALRRPR